MAVIKSLLAQQDDERAPFDPDEDFGFADVPARFVDDLDDSTALDEAWGDWLELTFNSEA
jgi:hypothetical protein